MRNSKRLISYDDLTTCEMCEDYWCPYHDKHFADCTSWLKWEWEEQIIKQLKEDE